MNYEPLTGRFFSARTRTPPAGTRVFRYIFVSTVSCTINIFDSISIRGDLHDKRAALHFFLNLPGSRPVLFESLRVLSQRITFKYPCITPGGEVPPLDRIAGCWLRGTNLGARSASASGPCGCLAGEGRKRPATGRDAARARL